jgi:hypothetical protein
MKGRILSLASALTILASGAVPAFAADSSSGGDISPKGVAMWPVKLVAMSAGAVVGTPIAVTRYVAKESVASTKKIAGDKANPIFAVACGVVGVPIGMFVGGMEGLYHGPANAYSHPFNKDAFTLGEIE